VAGAANDPSQSAMMKMMPLMFVGLLFVLPIPAGVLLYLVMTMLFMVAQNAWVHFADQKSADTTPTPPSLNVVDVKAK
jgi:membrane protein insertase Oxa1/YidC/SpoIIIJ